MNNLNSLKSLHPAPVYIPGNMQSVDCAEYPEYTNPEYTNPEYTNSNTIRGPKTGNKDSRCYTCKPRGKVLKHIINTSKSGRYIFNHDMHKRPVIILTSVKHYHSINDLNPEELADLFSSIRDFMTFWKIKDYQISFNMGKWQGHEHFHCKLRLPDNIVSKMRKEHFRGLVDE
jgi:hypothetical protein